MSYLLGDPEKSGRFIRFLYEMQEALKMENSERGTYKTQVVDAIWKLIYPYTASEDQEEYSAEVDKKLRNEILPKVWDFIVQLEGMFTKYYFFSHPLDSDGIDRIAAERLRQITEEKFDEPHDMKWRNSELIKAAICYAVASTYSVGYNFSSGTLRRWWPWDREWWKPSSRKRNLIKAGALIAAEIDRMEKANVGDEALIVPMFRPEGWHVFIDHDDLTGAPFSFAEKDHETLDQTEIESILDGAFDLLKILSPQDPELLRKKAEQLKGTDGEGHAVGLVVDRLLELMGEL
jgi:hypothetical protein